MNAAAEAVMKELPDLVLAYGNSDEYRYVKPHRLQSKIGRDTLMFVIECSKLLISVWTWMPVADVPLKAELTCVAVSSSTRTVFCSRDAPGMEPSHSYTLSCKPSDICRTKILLAS